MQRIPREIRSSDLLSWNGNNRVKKGDVLQEFLQNPVPKPEEAGGTSSMYVIST